MNANLTTTTVEISDIIDNNVFLSGLATRYRGATPISFETWDNLDLTYQLRETEKSPEHSTVIRWNENIGIAVDNCIHYVYRYKEYFSETNDYLKTVSLCQNSVGKAIRNTSLTIIAGFSILVFSNFYPTIYFGIFTALAMLIALLGSLTLLPILLKYINVQ